VIAKHIPMKVARKSSFGELVKYITDEQGKRERVGTINISNCYSTQTGWLVREVSATQARNTRAESDKTYHLLLSFAPGEVVRPEVLRDIEARVCAALGYAEHQRISAVHHDTHALHIHVAINKIHPDRLTLHEPYRDYKTLAEISAKLEIEHGLQLVNHRARKQGAQNRTNDMEHAGGIESLLGWIQRQCLEQIRGARSWKELHQVMHDSGLELRERANGLVITDRAGTMVKASSVARELSKTKLEAMFGGFEPSPELQAPPVREYQAQPMPSRIDTAALYATYKADQETNTISRGREWTRVRDQKTRLIEAAKRTGRLKRAAIKLMEGSAWSKKVLYSLTSRTLRAEVQKIHQQHLKNRQGIYDKYRRRAWHDWLQDKATAGDSEALAALRARRAATGIKGDSLAGKVVQNAGRVPGVAADSITKTGTIIYRVGASAIRDDGIRLQVSRGATQQGLEAALRLAVHRYGERVTVSGSAHFKEQIAHIAAAAKLAITFDDAALDSRRQALRNTPTNHQERHHDQQDHRRGSRRRVGGARSTASASGRPHGAGGAPVGAGRHAKPHIARVGAAPPPEGQNRMRNLSQLGVVRITSRSEVLLPRDVPGFVEHQGTQPDKPLRRSVYRQAGLTPEQAAADKFIAEREAKRLSGLDIPKHRPYSESEEGPATYAGTRRSGGHFVALLRRGDEVRVMPIDEPTASRMKRMTVGDPITITERGEIKKRGRSR
jgi:Relaxase/Mobilisation nuclease domain/Large polyvalent protein-associated domain 7